MKVRKRIRPEGCWSFCGQYCALEENNLCRRSIPDYEMDEPNASADTIAELEFGRRDYMEEKNAFYKAVSQWWSKGKEGLPPKRWWETLDPPDPKAGQKIYQDRNQETLWSPYEIENLIATTPAVIGHVRDAAERYVQTKQLRDWDLQDLESALIDMFYEAYRGKPDYSELISSFRDAVSLIAQWCLQSYFMDYEEWATRMVRYHLISDQWKQELMKAKASASAREVRDGVVMTYKPRGVSPTTSIPPVPEKLPQPPELPYVKRKRKTT